MVCETISFGGKSFHSWRSANKPRCYAMVSPHKSVALVFVKAARGCGGPTEALVFRLHFHLKATHEGVRSCIPFNWTQTKVC